MNENQKEYSVNFVADANLVSVLGEQLIGSERVGILEIIKNSYDAGASKCEIWIEKIPGLPEHSLSDPELENLKGPVITVKDNGTGMDKSTIINGWLRPATTIKTSVKERLKREKKLAEERGTLAEYDSIVRSLKREHKGRIPLGEKGVGRFATHRLGTDLILKTKVAEVENEWYLKIDWSLFEIDYEDQKQERLDLSKIKLKLIERSPTIDYGETNSGTLIRVYGGREGYEWSETKLLDVAQAIAQLQSPSAEEMGFKVDLIAPQLSEEIEVPTRTVPSPFELTAIVDEVGLADIEIVFTPPQSLKKPMPAQKWNQKINLRKPPGENKSNYWLEKADRKKLRKPVSGPFSLELKLWLRTTEWVDAPDIISFTDYLDAFGGIAIYRDGLSILPAHITSRDDWLNLSKRHIKRGVNISYYQMAGNLDLEQEKTLGLIDRTSREGLLETKPFEDLGNLVKAIVFELEYIVKETRDRYNALKQGEKLPTATLNKRTRIDSQVFGAIAKEYNFKEDKLQLSKIIGESDEPKESIIELSGTLDDLRKEITDQRNQIDALLETAGYGIAIGVAIHEIEKITSNLFFGIDKLSKGMKNLNEDDYRHAINLKDMSKALLNELKRLAPLRVTRLEKPTTFKIRDAILAAKAAFRLKWEDAGIQFHQTPKEHNFDFTGSFGMCSQIFANLFDNATYWLLSVDDEKRRIYVQVDEENNRVIVGDNGPGVDPKITEHLFKPFYSLKIPPSGLGLYISDYYMRQMKGKIRESFERERITGFEGAHFTLMFPREGIDK